MINVWSMRPREMQTESHDGHQKDKNETREEREKDRKSKSRTEAIICFDLQNVLVQMYLVFSIKEN